MFLKVSIFRLFLRKVHTQKIKRIPPTKRKISHFFILIVFRSPISSPGESFEIRCQKRLFLNVRLPPTLRVSLTRGSATERDFARSCPQWLPSFAISAARAQHWRKCRFFSARFAETAKPRGYYLVRAWVSALRGERSRGPQNFI